MYKFKQWLDDVDPYAIQRITFYKALFIATIGVYVYWFFLPVNFMAFILPFFIVSLYEMPVLSSFKKKEQLLYFMAIAVILISVSFYLVYPFRGIFFFFSLFILTVVYFLVLKYFYALKNLIMLTLATGTIILGTEPYGSLQVAYGFVSSTALSMMMVLICLKIFPNQYLKVWNRALQGFIKYFEEDIELVVHDAEHKIIKEEIIHFEMVRNYQPLVGKKYMLSTYRVAVYIRNIQLSLDNLYYEKKNELFWQGVKHNLSILRCNMPDYRRCDVPETTCVPETKLQFYVMDCLNKAFMHWNTLCSLHDN